MNATFGTDAEFMLQMNNKIYSAIGVIHGTKENRISIKGHEFYYDNVLAECGIKYSRNKEETLENIKECLQIYSDMAHPYSLIALASHNFDRDQLDNEEAQNVGCAVDWCAYKIKLMKAPVAKIKEGTLRTCGGHVHLGADILRSDGPEPLYAVYMLDLLLGITSLWLDKDPTSKKRRSLYGQAGRYRVAGPENEPYGIEYRSLGNFWFKSPQLASLIYDLSTLAVLWVEDGTAQKMWKFDEDLFYELNSNLWKAYTCTYNTKMLQKAINNSDVKIAQPFLDFVLEKMPKDLKIKLINQFDKTYNSLQEEWGIKIAKN